MYACMQCTYRKARPEGLSTVHTKTLYFVLLFPLCCSENLSLNRVADDTNPAQGARPDWLGKGEGAPPAPPSMSKGWGAPGLIAGARTWVPGPTTPFPALALTSVHLIRPLKLVLNPMLYSTLAAKWANRHSDRLTGRFALTVHPPELVQPRRKSKQPRVTLRSGSLHDTPTADRHRITFTTNPLRACAMRSSCSQPAEPRRDFKI